MFFDAPIFCGQRHFEAWHVGGTWKSSLPQIEHILMLTYFGFSLNKVDTSFLIVLSNDIWTNVLLFLLLPFNSTRILDVQLDGKDFSTMQKAITKI